MTFSQSFISHSLGSLGFIILTIVAISGWRCRNSGRALIFAAFTSALWSLSIASQEIWGQPSFNARFTLEVLRNFAWAFLLLRVLGLDLQIYQNKKARPVFYLSIATAFFTFLPLVIRIYSEMSLSGSQPPFLSTRASLLGNIAYAIIGLILIEQVLRNTRMQNRWQIKFLCLALGLIIGYDFILYSNAFLYKAISTSLWDARGFVNALSIPLILISCRRNQSGPMKLNLSQDFTFHTVIFLGAGLYLIVMATVAYYIRSFGGDAEGTLEVIFLVLGTLLLIVMVFSGSLRARLRVLISKNLFSYRYDYRKEWLSITDILSSTNSERPLPERAIVALANLVDSQGGTLWTVDAEGCFQFRLSLISPKPPVSILSESEPLVRFLKEKNWVIDLKELKSDPELYGYLLLPEWILEQKSAWLITPLMLHDALYGFVTLDKSRSIDSLNWEDHDIIKVAGHQAASALAQMEASEALSKAAEFDAFNQMSAFIVHDIKTLVSQLSLMVKNAEKHKNNPAFIDDMVKTTDHSVTKMTRLLSQLSETRPDRGEKESNKSLELNTLLQQLSDQHQNRLPCPHFQQSEQELSIMADQEKLLNVLSHLIKNAQEACEKNDSIVISLEKRSQNAIIKLIDTGCGMTQSFIEKDLFQPFRSTKGVSGMGIGAFQCQQYIRKLKGSIDVSSGIGEGSTFTVTLPLANDQE